MSSQGSQSALESYPAPGLLKFSAVVAIFQSIVAFLVGIWLIIGDFRTRGESGSLVSDSAAVNWVGTGTAVFIFIVFGVTMAAGINILRDKSWARGAMVLLQILLLFVAFYMFSGGAVAEGTATALSAILILVGYFHPQSSQWFADTYRIKQASA